MRWQTSGITSWRQKSMDLSRRQRWWNCIEWEPSDAEALVRHGDQPWTPLSQTELMEGSGSESAEADAGDLTDLSELSFEFEESASIVSAVQESSAVDSDASEIGDLSELQFEFEETVTQGQQKFWFQAGRNDSWAGRSD